MSTATFNSRPQPGSIGNDASRYTRDIKDFHVVVPQKIHSNESFNSHFLNHYYEPSVRKKRNLDGERVYYRLDINGQPHILELEPNPHVTSPGMMVETRRGSRDVSGSTFQRPRKHLCHYRGSVRGQPGSRVALSGCDGLVGYVRTKDGLFFVEPVHGDSPEEGEEHVHVVYKRSLDNSHNKTCNVKGAPEDWWAMWCSRLRSMLETKALEKRSEVGVTTQRWYEAMVVADRKFLMFHKDHDVEEYIICIMNMVSDFYHDASIGNLIDITIVRIVYLEKQENELDLEINTRGENTLSSFCKWQNKMNPKDHNHPNHHDIAVLFTRYDICSEEDNSCSLLGLANLGSACSDTQNCCINEDAGLILGVTTAHELGHTLGCTHDAPDESGCEAVAPGGDSTVMNPTVTGATSAWSSCSRGFITGLFDSQMGECMLDEPKDHAFPLDEMPPGAFYNADEQCTFLFGPDYMHYDQGGDKMCSQLWCKTRDAASTMSLGDPPAEGTNCGPNKWCFNKECVAQGQRLAAVNGEWGEWKGWSECSRSCGGGVSVRERKCDNPQPQHKGRYCLGQRHEYAMCNTQDCPPGPAFKATQCSEFDDKAYQGLIHTWKPFDPPDSDPNPCALYCINEQNVFTKLAPRVKDGTRCKRGTKDTCVQGSCLAVGCDWKLFSDAVEDVCGDCEGDGTLCTIVDQTIKTIPKKGYAELVVVPPGARNIHFEELKPTGNMIAVSAIDNKTFYVNGGYTEYLEGEYDFGGVKGVHEKPEKEKGEIHIKGPIVEPLVLWGVFFEDTNPGMKYSFSIPSEKPTYSPKYHWEFADWGPCSARCGGGTQLMKQICVEERDGKVKDSYCKDKPKSEPRARACNDQPCRTRWKVWKWGPCSGCLFRSGTRTRLVECVKESPTLTDDEEIITEPSECCGEMPSKSQLCNSPKPCTDNITSNLAKKREVLVVPMKKWIEKRENEAGGKSFSDMSRSTIVPVKDVVHSETIHLHEVMLDENHLNLTEKEFEEMGDEVPSKVLSCEMQNLTGKDALERLQEVIHGPGYNRNSTKVSMGDKGERKCQVIMQLTGASWRSLLQTVPY
ncbi:A disintegrin and metalloproteinase with thrombospondin motifs 7-like [Macrosteles quadrilineatus]|uniref:A disintegrin and metalloproteinase with thrombospondin motifs 7-like n=1 Tax=Macrosteles quadrilineatus TaxID=74068 RepID=UPI0023E197A1|nr:A disintegrin and metalloproteinase with thrombospondin motifs 7-like [Macrosteles quadrilineatus]